MNFVTVYFDFLWGDLVPGADCPEGQPAKAYKLQIEPLTEDNTGLNGIRLQCGDDSKVENEGWWGDFDNQWTKCPGGYFYAARVEVLKHVRGLTGTKVSLDGAKLRPCCPFQLHYKVPSAGKITQI